MKSIIVRIASLFVLAVCMAGSAMAANAEVNACFGPTLDMPYGKAHVYWAKILKEQSNGAFVMNVFPSDQLGSGKDCIDQAWMGDPLIYSTDASFFADLGVPDMAIVQAPFLCETWEQMGRIFASDWWAEQEKALEAKGLKVLAANWRYGDRHTITTRLVKTPADMAGMKIRVPQSTVYVKSFEALGAAPTPLALGEVYTALQQGVIEGLENPLATIYGGKYQEVAKFLLLDAHMKTMNIVVCGTSFFDTLSPEHQSLLMKTAKEAGEYQNRLLADDEEEILNKLKAEGVTVTAIEYREFKDAARKFYDYPEFSKWTKGLYEKIQAIINE